MSRAARLAYAMARALISGSNLAPVEPRSATGPSPIIRLVEDPLRCRCPECLQLDLLHPGEGYQLQLFPYVIQRGPTP